MSHLISPKIAIATAVTLGSFIGQIAPANAISLGFDPNYFSQLDADDNEDRIAEPNSITSVDIILDTDGLGSETISEITYEINDTNFELTFDSANLDQPDFFATTTSDDSLTDLLEVSHSGGSITEAGADGGIVLDTITYTTAGSLPNDGFNDLNFATTQLLDSNGNQITLDNTSVDLEGEVQVPFEAETSMGLIAIAGFFGLRKLRQRQQSKQS